MKLQKMIEIEGRIRVLTGLHIGAGKESMEIGGMDQPIIKNPLTGAPYVPGSSLKGKMRALLEQTLFLSRPETKRWVIDKGQACACGQVGCMSCTLFGTSAKDKSKDLGPTRLIVRDAYLSREWDERFQDGKLTMEVKFENTIHRVKGVAKDPRSLERVPAGVEFELNMSLKVFEGDDERELVELVKKGLKLIELDALGGNSSRGCGQVSFQPLSIGGEQVSLADVNPL